MSSIQNKGREKIRKEKFAQQLFTREYKNNKCAAIITRQKHKNTHTEAETVIDT
jgi:hypothetical protein